MDAQTAEAPKETVPTPQVVTEGNGTPSNATAAAPATAMVGGGKNVVIPDKALKARLAEEREKGKKAAMIDFEQKMKAKGFSSLDEMLDKLAQATTPKVEAPKAKVAKSTASEVEVETPEPSPSANRQDQKVTAKYEREAERWKKQAEENARKARYEEKRRREADRARDAKEAESDLKLAAVRAGISDPRKVSFAIHLLTQELEGKSEQDLAAFDEGKFFTTLKETEPYLFGIKKEPATTGTGVSGTPPAPGPGQTARTAAESGQVDARKMNRKEFDEHLRKRNLNPNLAGAGTG